MDEIQLESGKSRASKSVQQKFALQLILERQKDVTPNLNRVAHPFGSAIDLHRIANTIPLTFNISAIVVDFTLAPPLGYPPPST